MQFAGFTAEPFESLRTGDRPPIPTADVMCKWPQEEPIDVKDDTFMKYGYPAQPWLDLSACHAFSMVLQECTNEMGLSLKTRSLAMRLKENKTTLRTRLRNLLNALTANVFNTSWYEIDKMRTVGGSPEILRKELQDLGARYMAVLVIPEEDEGCTEADAIFKCVAEWADFVAGSGSGCWVLRTTHCCHLGTVAVEQSHGVILSECRWDTSC